VEVGEDEADFGGGEDDGESFRAFSAWDFADLAEVLMEDLFIEEHNGIESLVLGRSRDLKGAGEVGEEGSDILGAHREGVFFVVEDDEAFDPVGIGFDGTRGQVAKGGEGTDLVEEFRLGHC
jgi:hypothetical protein